MKQKLLHYLVGNMNVSIKHHFSLWSWYISTWIKVVDQQTNRQTSRTKTIIRILKHQWMTLFPDRQHQDLVQHWPLSHDTQITIIYWPNNLMSVYLLTDLQSPVGTTFPSAGTNWISHPTRSITILVNISTSLLVDGPLWINRTGSAGDKSAITFLTNFSQASLSLFRRHFIILEVSLPWMSTDWEGGGRFSDHAGSLE